MKLDYLIQRNSSKDKPSLFTKFLFIWENRVFAIVSENKNQRFFMSEFTSACFVAQIDMGKSEALKELLIDQGFELGAPAFTLFQGKKKGISVTLYTSGKLTVQGKDKKDFITFYLEPLILENVSYTYPLAHVALHPRIGIDEAGKGDYFGPLCIGGIFVNGEEDLKTLMKLGVKDSKRLSDSTICLLSKKLKEQFKTTVITISPKKYNELYSSFGNLNQLLAWGHSAAIENLVKLTGCKDVIIDQFGKEYLVENAIKRKKLELNLTQRHKGEEDLAVAGASILARAAFVEGIELLERTNKLILPKGVSHAVKQAAQKARQTYGDQILETIAKLHFKTTEEILNHYDA